MADSKDSDPKANQAPADAAKTSQPASGEGRSGAVKPPVLDLTARPVGAEPGKADAAKTDSGKPDSGKAEANKPGTTAGTASSASFRPTGTPSAGAAADKAKPTDKPRPAAPAESGSGFGFGAALVGGLLGLGAAYGLAYAGLWPAPPVAPAVADPRLASYGKAIPELETVTQTTQAELARLNQRVASLEQDTPAADTAAPVDLGGITDDLAALGSRVDSLEQVPAAESETGALDALRSDFTALGSRIDELAARLGTAEASLRTLDTTVAETSAAVAAQPSDIGAVLQLPLILSGLETAFATGRPYESELGTLRAAAPSASIPTVIANKASQGLTRPDVIARRFDAVLPAILAGRPADPDAQWQTGALNWFAGAIALRPTGEMDGDTPEAITSRLIGAVERRDFATAQTLLQSLPQPMQAAAADVPDLLAEQAEAEAFLQSLRDSALTGEVGQ